MKHKIYDHDIAKPKVKLRRLFTMPCSASAHLGKSQAERVSFVKVSFVGSKEVSQVVMALFHDFEEKCPHAIRRIHKGFILSECFIFLAFDSLLVCMFYQHFLSSLNLDDIKHQATTNNYCFAYPTVYSDHIA